MGAGGMGEVYRATDRKLKRQVAIKILPSSVAVDADRLARFQREAEVLASLNHPHIAGIYGLEDSDGTKALVMELVEGSTLAERLALGPIPVDEALKIARQITMPSRLPMRKASCIVTSNHPTSRSGPTARSRCWISASPRRSLRIR
jgi:Protein kinase domain